MTTLYPTRHAENLRVRAGSKRWHAARMSGLGASEIAVALGISPYSSPRELYWRKRGELADAPDTARMEWGRRLERAILARFLDDHPQFKHHRPTLDKLYRSRERHWQLATPDALVWTAHEFNEDAADASMCMCGVPALAHSAVENPEPVVVEIKTGASREEWGEDGSDDVPVHYRAQVQQSMDVVGARLAFMPVLFNGRDYRCFTIRYDGKDVRVLRARGEEFWRRVQEGNPPPVDGHPATTSAMKTVWDVDPEASVVVPARLVERCNRAKAVHKAAGVLRDRYENELRDLVGVAHKAVTPDGATAATRSKWEQGRFDLKRFREDHPELAESYTVPEPRQRLNIRNIGGKL